MKMTVTITLGTLIKVVLALTVVLTVIVMLLAGVPSPRQDTQGTNTVPPTADIRADR
jgi:hypothetical protein